MKKLFWSAFAMSLILLSPQSFAQTEAVDDFLGLESEILPDLKGEQRFTAPDLHEKESWNVPEKNIIIDLAQPNKGQGHSIIPWSTQDPEDFLSINTWLIERSVKDVTPDWKIRLRQADLKELSGKLLQCIGTCDIYRGSNKASGQHLSRLLEGDELKTGKDSVAWVYMMDGSLMRLSPETSVSINEFNVGKTEIFILARLNQGHVFWHPRNKKEMVPEFSPETDSVSLPLMVRAANQQAFERKIFQAQKDEGHLSEIMILDDKAVVDQFKALNQLKNENNPGVVLGSKLMMVTPNSTIVAKDVSFDYLYLPGGKGYFKKRSTEVGEEFSLYLRGYAETQVNTISEASWHVVDDTGRTFIPISMDAPGILQVTELLTKRIKTIELAREIWVKEFTLPVMAATKDSEALARDYGYTLWGDEASKRLDFLVEYTRRIETTNLRSIENLLTKLESNGEKSRRDLSEDHYRASLNHYLLGLKSRYDNRKMRVREMNDLQYYVWILKNGKF